MGRKGLSEIKIELFKHKLSLLTKKIALPFPPPMPILLPLSLPIKPSKYTP
jgi:hypothetical protein